MNSALILVDIQQDYFPKGRMELVGPVEASQQAKRLLEYFRKEKLPIVHIQHISTRKDATFFLPGTTGIDFHENVAPLAGEKIFEKHFPNSFRDTGLQEYLHSNEIQQIVISGMMTHMCVDATVRAAVDTGYTCLVAHDACATKNLSFNGTNVQAQNVQASYMAALGAVYAKVMSTEETIKLLKKG